MGDSEIKGRQREVNNNIESYTIKNEEHSDEYVDGKIEQKTFKEEIFEKENDKDVENKFTMAKKTKEDNFEVLRMTNEDLQYIPMRDWKEVTEVGSEKYCETSIIEWEGGEVCRLLAELRNFCTCENTDVLVECRGRRMPCHSGFLRARSNTLRRMLESAEVQEDQVKIIELDMEPGVVEITVRYIYSGELEPVRPPVRLAQLVTAAAWLEIPGLIAMCGQIMEKIVDVEELVEVLVVTEEWGLHSLGKVAVDLINRDRGRFIVNPVFQSLMIENPGCLLKLYQSVCYPEPMEEGMSRKMMLRTCYRCGVSSYTTYCSWCQDLGSGPKE